MNWLNRDLIVGPYLALCTAEVDFHKVLRHCAIPKMDWPEWIQTPQADATCHFLKNPKQELCAVVCLRLREGVEGLQVASLLVHEAVHVWQEFKEHIGEHSPSREFEAYSIQAISQRLMQAYADGMR